MRLSAILGPLLDAKADHELIRKMVLAHEQEQADKLEQRRESDRKRQAAKAERDKKSRDSREPYDAASSRASATRVEDNLQTKILAGQKKEERKEDARKRAFSDFWAIFPNKVGKRDAETAFLKALTRADPETILDGVRRYAAKTDDRPWCNPATFLNQDRWTDMPAAPPIRQATAPPGNGAMDAYHQIARAKGWTSDEPTILPGNNADAQRLPAAGGSGPPGVVVELRRGSDGAFGSGNR
jgi:hypothetical protein